MLRCLSRSLTWLALLPALSHSAWIYRPVLNVQTGRPDLVTPLSTSTVQAGSNVTVSTNSDGSITIGATGGGGGGSTNGTVLASTPTNVAVYSNTTTVTGYGNLTNDGTFVAIKNPTHAQTISMYHENLPINGGFGPQVPNSWILSKLIQDTAVGNFILAASTGVSVSTRSYASIAISPPVTTSTGSITFNPAAPALASSYLIDGNGFYIPGPLKFGTFSGTAGIVGQALISSGTGVSPSWQTIPTFASTQTWTGGNTFVSSTTFRAPVLVRSSMTVIPSTTATYSLYLSTAVSGGNSIAVSTKSTILLNGSAGSGGQVLTSAGASAIPTWVTPTVIYQTPWVQDIDANGFSLESNTGNVLLSRDGGRVGIGTASPSRNFQVTQSEIGLGSINADGTSAVVGTGTNFKSTFKLGDLICIAGPECYAIDSITDDENLTIAGTFTPYGPVGYTLYSFGDRFSVSGNGNVGIGNITPKTNLQVEGYGGLLTTDNITDTTLTGNYWFDGTNWRLINSDASSMIRLTGGTITFYADAAGTADDVVAPTPIMQMIPGVPANYALCLTLASPPQLGHCTDIFGDGSCDCVSP